MNKITALLFLVFVASYGQTGIGTTSPHISAILEISSTTGGLLVPRMTESQRNAINSPADGLMIHNTTTGCIDFRKSGGWQSGCISRIPPPSHSAANKGRCGGGNITATATSSAGTVIEWYSAASGGTLLATGNSYTRNITSATTVYVCAFNNVTNERSARTAVLLDVGAVPTLVPRLINYEFIDSTRRRLTYERTGGAHTVYVCATAWGCIENWNIIWKGQTASSYNQNNYWFGSCQGPSDLIHFP